MKLSWYINRLRSMEPAELAHRLTEKSRKIASKRRHQGWTQFPAAQVGSVVPGFAEQVRAASPNQREAVSEASQAILHGQYTALGQVWPRADGSDVFPPERWRLDPVTGQLWPGPERYCFEVDFRHNGTRGDIKYVWEFNRLQFLPVLAAQWVLSGDDDNIATIERAIGSWYSANPPFGGVAWASGIEVALRAISVILTLELAGSRLSPKVIGQAGQILSASRFWLKRFPSRFSSANNHLVAELAGEYLIGQAIGQPDTKAWQGLLAELGRQILPDGGGAEQTPTYAAFTAELVLLAALAARKDGMALPQAGAERLAAFHSFLAWIGPDARFGDDDEGRVVTLGSEGDYQGSVGSAIAAFLGISSQLRSAQDFRALLFGQPAQAVSPPKGLRIFEQTGLSVWRGQMSGHEALLRFDHGPLGYLSIAAHGHA
ncbi:MAG TPA: heparinase, partial [Devosia sp.]